ncbi:uncharacterized protein LOC129919809 isoform X4 [Episyrphus balteatus]|uniref:uncharacterized protein LOC129919809 isoform X4 n=1 Tax=Episyrphus balteatus TaxID=286459 RepID=UPI0024867CCC|nr:uncharacterized protein LOC129919809 isoform X4 [Episyrphus balteatus]
MRSESNLCNLAKMPYSILDLRYNNQNKLLRIRCKHRVKKGFVNADLLHKEIHQLNKLYSTNASSNRTNVFYLSLLLLLYSCVLIRASTSIPPEESTTIRAGYNNDNDGLALNKSLHLNKSDEITSFRKDEILQPSRVTRDVSHVPDEDDDSSYRDDEMDEYDLLINNKSAKGKYIGAPCNDLKCEASLVHVSCDKETLLCGCEKNYPVVLGLTKGCDKPKKLGEQCFYHETCIYNDENSLCVQVRHNARCQCANGFHSVSYTKPSRRVFCTQDIDELTSDLPTLLGVSTGIAVLAGLICMVLHLFSKTKYPRHRNFGDANLPPPIMYSSDTGIPLTVQSGRPSSRSSMRSSGSIGSYGNRRSSSTMQSGSGGGSKGILVSTSRTGSRRPSLASVHSTSSSVRSYSMMRFEKETQQKELRQEMKLRLARLQHQQHMSHNKPQIVIGDSAAVQQHSAIARVNVPTPSPLTPNSTDELLPSVDETQEFASKPEAVTAPNAYHGPCASSSEDL